MTFILFMLGDSIPDITIGCAILMSAISFGQYLIMDIVNKYIEEHPDEYKEFLEKKMKEAQDEKPFD